MSPMNSNEREFLKSMRDDYYVDSSLSYVAHKVGMTVSQAMDTMIRYKLPAAGDSAVENKKYASMIDALLGDGNPRPAA